MLTLLGALLLTLAVVVAARVYVDRLVAWDER